MPIGTPAVVNPAGRQIDGSQVGEILTASRYFPLYPPKTGHGWKPL
jgi:hypothetical protein